MGGGRSNAPPPAGGGKSRGPAGRGLMDVGDTCTFCCISYLNVSTHLKFVLVSSC